MFILTTGVHQYIIDEHYDKHIKIWSKHSIHEVHKSCWGISYPERHNKKLKIAITSSESGFQDVTLPNFELMIAKIKVYLWQITCTFVIGQTNHLFSEGGTYFLRWLYSVSDNQCTYERAIFISHKQQRSTPRKNTGLMKPLSSRYLSYFFNSLSSAGAIR